MDGESQDYEESPGGGHDTFLGVCQLYLAKGRQSVREPKQVKPYISVGMAVCRAFLAILC